MNRFANLFQQRKPINRFVNLTAALDDDGQVIETDTPGIIHSLAIFFVPF